MTLIRLHGALGDQSPAEFERRELRMLRREPGT